METIEVTGKPYSELWEELGSMDYALQHLMDPNWKLGALDRDQLTELSALLKALSTPSSERRIYLRMSANAVLNTMRSYSYPTANLRKEVQILKTSPESATQFRDLDRSLSRLSKNIEKVARHDDPDARGKLLTTSTSDLTLLRDFLERLLSFVAANLPEHHAEIEARISPPRA